MYELWIATNYIQGKKLGRASKSLELLKKRACQHFQFEVVFTNELEKDSKCIWIDAANGGTPVGLIQEKQ